MKKNKTITSTKDQASALLTETLKCIREEHLASEKAMIISDYNKACEEIQVCRRAVRQIINSNRGGAKGMHGFLGERAQVHISNAEALVNGNCKLYEILDNNGPIDYMKDSVPVQQKACQSDGRLGLNHVQMHLKKYPFFPQEGGIYQIPKDFYQKYNRLKNMSPEIAGKLRNEEYSLWKYIQQFTKENPDIKIEPMTVSYKDIQVGTIEKTLSHASKHHKEIKQQRIENAVRENAPCVKEFTQVCLCSAGIEGVTEATMLVAEKIQSGKHLRAFNSNDYYDIGKQALVGSGKGAVRGAMVYIATNYTPIPAPIATAGTTAAFDITSQAIKYKKGEITKEECVHNSIKSVTDVAVSTTSSMIGAKLISRLLPAKYKAAGILGSLFGNVVGMAIYGVIKQKVYEPKEIKAQKNGAIKI